MAKIKYSNIRMNAERSIVVDRVNRIVTEYRQQGYSLSLRQVYYLFVSRNWIANKQSEYKRLGDIINDGRMAGLIDWNAIEDRTRELDGNTHWDSPQSIIRAVSQQYMIDKWVGQTYRPEVWVEKDALEGVVGQAARALDIHFFSCRGYTSQTAMHDHAERLKGYMADGQRPVILHLGDHDPSGIDMSRDIQDRLNTFTITDWAREEMEDAETAPEFQDDILDDIEQRCGQRGVVVKRIALTMAQVRQYNPPPNPAKPTDARYEGYRRQYGDECWELDALEPSVIDKLIRDEVGKLREDRPYRERQNKERTQKSLLAATSDRWDDVTDFLTGTPG